MMRPPPRSTLFPYTTLFRSPDPLIPNYQMPNATGRQLLSSYARHLLRSEEHTSELQSLTNLVCRLLLEKKKKNDIINSYRPEPMHENNLRYYADHQHLCTQF